MNSTPGEQGGKAQQHESYDLLTEVYEYLEVVFASLIMGVILGMIAYSAYTGKERRVLAIAVCAATLVTGIVLATRAWKKKGISLFGSGSETAQETSRKENTHSRQTPLP